MRAAKYFAVLGVLTLGAFMGIAADRSIAQTPPPAYYVAELKVTDPDGIKPYREKVGAIIDKFGGKFLVRANGKIEALEGDPPNGGLVIIAFKSAADAHRWYDSPEYREIIEFRHRSAKTRAALVEGVAN